MLGCQPGLFTAIGGQRTVEMPKLMPWINSATSAAVSKLHGERRRPVPAASAQGARPRRDPAGDGRSFTPDGNFRGFGKIKSPLIPRFPRFTVLQLHVHATTF